MLSATSSNGSAARLRGHMNIVSEEDSYDIRRVLVYSEENKRNILSVYDSLEDKSMAMQLIKSISGFETLYERKIVRWKNAALARFMRRAIPEEFDTEVYEEYLRVDPDTDFLEVLPVEVSLLNAVALGVLNRDYLVDGNVVKKWRLDRRTRSLVFDQQWSVGFVNRRRQLLRAQLDSTADDGEVLPAVFRVNENGYNIVD